MSACAVSQERVFVQLPEDIRLEPHQPFVVLDRRQHLGVQNRPVIAVHVVIHPVRVDQSIPFAKDDVSFEIEFPATLGDLMCRTRRQSRGRVGPDHDPVGFQRHGVAFKSFHVFNAADDRTDAARDATITSSSGFRPGNDFSCIGALLREMTCKLRAVGCGSVAGKAGSTSGVSCAGGTYWVGGKR